MVLFITQTVPSRKLSFITAWEGSSSISLPVFNLLLSKQSSLFLKDITLPCLLTPDQEGIIIRDINGQRNLNLPQGLCGYRPMFKRCNGFHSSPECDILGILYPVSALPLSDKRSGRVQNGVSSRTSSFIVSIISGTAS